MTSHQSIDDKLDAVLADYFQRLDRGEAVSPTSLFASHPELAAELREFFDAANFIENLAGPTQAEQTQMLSVHDTARNSLVGETLVSSDVVRSLRERTFEGDIRAGGAIRAGGDIVAGGNISAGGEIKCGGHSARGASGPQHFGRYEIVRLLGQGAMGSVYLAYDPGLQRHVALKIPKFSDEANPDMRDRFLREARSAATLRHANICPVYDVGRVDGVHYITMAYIEGRTLAEELRAGHTFEPREIAAIIRKLALALGKAHSAGVVHRDLKPGNIMLDAEGEPVLMDFGLAYREETDELRLTKSGMLVGSPAYMSPEQIEGDPAKIGSASDIYSLGVVLYEMITGKLPFQGTMLSVIGQIATKEPAPVGQWRPDLAHSPLEQLCRKMLAKRPEDRPQTMQEVAQALDFILSGLPDGGVGNALRGVPSAQREAESGMAGERETATPAVAPASPPLPLAPAPPLFASGEPAVKFPAAPLAQRRQRTAMFIATTLVLVVLLGLFAAAAAIVVYIATDQGTLEITSHADDVKIEVIGDNGHVRVVDLDTGTRVVRLPSGEYSIVLSGNRNDVALDHGKVTVKRGGKTVITAHLTPDPPRPPPPGPLPVGPLPDPATTRQANAPVQPLIEAGRLEGHTDAIDRLTWSPDGRVLFSGGGEKQVYRWPVAAGGPPQKIAAKDYITALAAVDSDRVVVAEFDGKVTLRRVSDGATLREYPSHSSTVRAAAVSPDSRRVLTGGYDGAVRLVDLESGDVIRTFNEGFCSAVAFSADGRMAAHGLGSRIHLWDVQTGKTVRRIERKGESVFALAFSPDGRRLVSGSGQAQVEVWEIASGQRLYRLPQHTADVHSIDFLPEGKHFVTGCFDKSVRVFELAGGREVARATCDGYSATQVAVSANGQIASGGGILLHLDEKGQHTSTKDGDYAIRLWQLPPGLRPLAEIDTAERLFTGPDSHGFSIAVSKDGTQALVGHYGGGVSLWDVASGKQIRRFDGPEKAVHSVHFWPDGKHAVAASEDGTIRVWNLDSATEVRRFAGHGGRVDSVALSPDGLFLLSGSADYGQDRDTTVRLWDAAKGQELRRFGEVAPYTRKLVFSRDGVKAFGAAVGLASVVEWDVASGNPVHRWTETATPPISLAVSPDGTLLAVGYAARERQGDRWLDPENCVVRLWDVASRSIVRELRGHTGPIGEVAFTPDGRFVISAATYEHHLTDQAIVSSDQTVRVWSASTGQEAARFQTGERIIQLAVLPDGKSFLTVGDSIRLWRFAP